VPPDVARDLCAAGRVAHHGDVVEIERFDRGGQVVGVAVHVVARPRLAGSAMAAPVVGDPAEAVLREE
jgi:hypothetical protein